MIKKLRKFSNTTILCITDDHHFKEVLKKELVSAKELLFFGNNDEIILENVVDILLVDYRIDNALEVLNRFKKSKPLLPKIVILNNQIEENIAECINAGVYSILSAPLNFEDLKLSITVALNQSKRVDKVSLDNGIYYDSYRERFYDSFGEISFTKYEFQVLKLLLDNSTKIISYDTIKEKVWKEKKMSIFTMRNVINKIRNKTYYGIIKNNSSAGYQIDTLK